MKTTPSMIGMVGISFLFWSFVFMMTKFDVVNADEDHHKKYNYEISRVIDGDTVELKVDWLPVELGDNISLRINGIDAPEIRGKCYEEYLKALRSKVFLREMIDDAQKYRIVIYDKDKYFRLVGDIIIDNEYASTLMIKSELARPYNGRSKTSWCETNE